MITLTDSEAKASLRMVEARPYQTVLVHIYDNENKYVGVQQKTSLIDRLVKTKKLKRCRPKKSNIGGTITEYKNVS